MTAKAIYFNASGKRYLKVSCPTWHGILLCRVATKSAAISMCQTNQWARGNF